MFSGVKILWGGQKGLSAQSPSVKSTTPPLNAGRKLSDSRKQKARMRGPGASGAWQVQGSAYEFASRTRPPEAKPSSDKRPRAAPMFIFRENERPSPLTRPLFAPTKRKKTAPQRKPSAVLANTYFPGPSPAKYLRHERA